MMRADTATSEIVSWTAPSMGGRLTVVLTAGPERRADATNAARRTAQRVDTWAARLTRFNSASDLCRLNDALDSRVAVRPTLAAALSWAATAERRTDGVVDATLLDARLAAEHGDRTPLGRGRWCVLNAARPAVIERPPAVRFDLDGLAKGWIADRAADLLSAWPGVAVDADGDIAITAAPGVEWLIGVADPRSDSADGDRPMLATLRLTGGELWSRRYGVATSGTSVHRWQLAGGAAAHHLIDPRTGRPAQTDVIQATVVAPSAREAEVVAKAAVILGSDEALGFLHRSAALAALLLLESGDVACLPGVDAWLA